MDNKEIHVLYGKTGEYDEEVRWTVCASFNKELLEYHKIKCTEEANRIIKDIHKMKSYTHHYNFLVEEKKIEPHATDSNFQIIDSEVEYYIQSVPILGVKTDV